MLQHIVRNKNICLFFRRHLNGNGGVGRLAYIQKVGKNPLIYESMGQQFQRSVEKYGQRTAIKSWYDQKSLTFEELYEEAATMVVKLNEVGLKQGQHLAVWAPNTMQWYITFLASALGGFPLVCINPVLQKLELKFALEKAKAKMLITMDSYGKCDFLTTVEQVVDTGCKVIMKTDKEMDKFLNYNEWLKRKPSSQQIGYCKLKVSEQQPESPFLVQFTSGTTGQPKAALISHFNMVNEAVYIGQALKLDQGPKTICLQVPMFHAFGLIVMAGAIKFGSTLCVPSPTFSAEASLEAIEREKCNVIIGTPTMFVDLVDHQMHLQRNTDSLELCLMGGSACSPEIVSRTKDILKVPEVRLGYGLSEATGAIFASDDTESSENVVLSCGTLCEHGEAKIVNENGKTLQFGEVGELWVRGWFMMMGYFEDEQSTMKAIDFNGWLKTGDQFTLQPCGTAFYQGRKKDIIIRGGENIFPKEVENFIDTHPSVLESQVIGVPHQRLGEEVCVYLRLRRDAKPLTLEDVKKFCQGQLAYFKVPAHLRIVQEFPKTTSGKIQKFKLQQMFETETK